MIPLCYRCEHRARFLENGRRPRYECGEVDSAVDGCYMFRPVKPLVLGVRENDVRPVTLNIFSGRVEGVRIADVELRDFGSDKPRKKGDSASVLPMWVKKDDI